jgi:hypothetical protein
VLAGLWARIRRRPAAPFDLRALNASEHAAALAAFNAASTRAREADREKRRLKKVVEAIPADRVFAGWRKRYGTPAEVLDHDAVRAFYAEHGKAVPTKNAEAPLIVEYVGPGEG